MFSHFIIGLRDLDNIVYPNSNDSNTIVFDYKGFQLLTVR